MLLNLAIAALFAFGPEDVDLRPSLTEAKHQGPRNTCSAFAATALAEFVLRERTGLTYDLSEAAAYWAGHTRGTGVTGTERIYAGVDGLAGFIAVAGVTQGVSSESAWPYDPQAKGFGKPPEGLSELPDRFESIRIPRTEIAAFLAREQRPVVMNVHWYPELMDAQGNALRLPNLEEMQNCSAHRGACHGHVILLVGYSRVARRFLFRNSWGAEWGNAGYGTLPEEWVTQHCELCYYDRARIPAPLLPGLDGASLR